jgi:hypothetical protein
MNILFCFILIIITLNFLLWGIVLLMKKPIIIYTDKLPRIKNNPALGMSFLMFIFIRKDFRNSAELIAHETVHFNQIRRFSPVGMAAIYFFSFIYLLITTGSLKTAYWNNVFEREARGETSVRFKKKR